jgi:hypothetical protein
MFHLIIGDKGVIDLGSDGIIWMSDLSSFESFLQLKLCLTPFDMNAFDFFVHRIITSSFLCSDRLTTSIDGADLVQVLVCDAITMAVAWQWILAIVDCTARTANSDTIHHNSRHHFFN